MRALRRSFIWLASAALAMPATAQDLNQQAILAPGDSALPQCLALDEALAQALVQSPEIELAEADRLRAKADLRDTRSVNRPQVSTFLRTQAGDNNLTGAGVENSVGVRVSQRLFDFGTNGLEKQAARLSVEAREFDVLNARNEAALQAALALIGYSEIDERIAITAQREAFFERERAATALALDLGGATRSDLAEVSARLADAAADRLELEFQRDRFSAAIARRLGTPGSLCEGALGDLARAPDPEIITSVEEALRRNPRIRAASLQREAQEARARRAQRNRLPAIDVVGIASYAQDNLGNDDFGLRERIGIDITVPLVTGGRLGADRDRANAEERARASDVQRLRLDLAERVEVAARRIASLRLQVERRGEVTVRQEEQFAAAQSEFAEGLRILPELVEDRLELEAARLNAVTARYGLLREVVELRALMGSLSAPDPLQSKGQGERPYGPY